MIASINMGIDACWLVNMRILGEYERVQWRCSCMDGA